MSKLGPLNDLFRKDTVTFTSPDGEVVPVKSNSLAKVNPEKVEARKALDRAREALREAEEHYRNVSRDDESSKVKLLDDFYAGKWILEYDRKLAMNDDGEPIKENFQITKVDKVVGIGNGFVSIKGKYIKIAYTDIHDVLGGRLPLHIYTCSDKYLSINHVDRVLTEKQLRKLLDNVRKDFNRKLESIW